MYFTTIFKDDFLDKQSFVQKSIFYYQMYFTA